MVTAWLPEVTEGFNGRIFEVYGSIWEDDDLYNESSKCFWNIVYLLETASWVEQVVMHMFFTCSIYTWFGCFFLLRQRMTQSQVPGTDFAEAQLLQCLVMGSSAEVEIGSTRKGLSPRDDGGGAAHTTDDCWCWRNGHWVYPLQNSMVSWYFQPATWFVFWLLDYIRIILDMEVSINEGYP